jgi:hypothetical protein
MSEIDDDRLLAVVGEVLAADEPISNAMASAVEGDAFAMRRIDAELAELLFDTLADASPAVRGDGPRSLSFAAAGHELDVELQADDHLVGRVSPPDVAVAVEGPDGAVQMDLDRLGRFTGATPATRVRFVLGASPGVVVTPWIFH